MQHPLQHHLTNKLIWMARQMREMNDVPAIIDWTKAMKAVHDMLVEILANKELLRLTHRKENTIRSYHPANKTKTWEQAQTAASQVPPSEAHERQVVKGKRKLMMACRKEKERKRDQTQSVESRPARVYGNKMEIEGEELIGITESIVVEGDEEVASGRVCKGESVKKTTNLTQEQVLNEEKEIWRKRLMKAFRARIKEKRHCPSSRQWWYNTKDKFNEFLKEVAKEANLELQRWPPEDNLLPTQLWSYLFMELDKWANDIFFD